MSETSSRLKAEAMCWLRYGKRLPAVCTEVQVAGGWLPDVVGCGPNTVVEVEVKVNRQDLLRDQANKAAKFWLYQNLDPSSRHTGRVPNYFYYMVPEQLQETALEMVKEGLTRAGVLVYKPLGLLDGRNLEIAKAAQKLHDQKPTQAFLHTVFLRTSSELCGTRVALNRLQQEVETMLDRVDAAVAENATYQGGILDIEDPETDLLQRCREALEAFEPGSVWEGLSPEDQRYYQQGVLRLVEYRKQVSEAWHEAQRR